MPSTAKLFWNIKTQPIHGFLCKIHHFFIAINNSKHQGSIFEQSKILKILKMVCTKGKRHETDTHEFNKDKWSSLYFPMSTIVTKTMPYQAWSAPCCPHYSALFQLFALTSFPTILHRHRLDPRAHESINTLPSLSLTLQGLAPQKAHKLQLWSANTHQVSYKRHTAQARLG